MITRFPRKTKVFLGTIRKHYGHDKVYRPNRSDNETCFRMGKSLAFHGVIVDGFNEITVEKRNC
jgi:hypothetical protein